MGACRLIATVSSIVALLVASEARAYVPQRTPGGLQIHWGGSCAFITPDVDPPFGWTLGDMTAALNRAVDNWQSVVSGCSYLKINVDTPASGEAHNDHKNVVKVRKDQWCRPAETNQPQICFSHSISSITTVLFDVSTGEITDADIELNDIDFTFLNYPTTAQPRAGTVGVDLENTLTHELGHLQGLDHTCWDRTSPTQPTDDTGTLVPACDSLDSLSSAQRAKITTATMFPFPTPGDISERSPEVDDKNGICAIYPTAKDPGRCQRVGGTGSSSSGCSVGGTGLVGLLAVLSRFAFVTVKGRRRR